jgi:hypothetical protein
MLPLANGISKVEIIVKVWRETIVRISSANRCDSILSRPSGWQRRVANMRTFVTHGLFPSEEFGNPDYGRRPDRAAWAFQTEWKDSAIRVHDASTEAYTAYTSTRIGLTGYRGLRSEVVYGPMGVDIAPRHV